MKLAKLSAYAILGFLLNQAGVTVFDSTLGFFAIIACVIVIDILSDFQNKS
jgi:hypothetical protein